MTTGVALAGASVIVVTPIAPAPQDITIGAGDTASVQLTAGNYFFERLGQSLDNTLYNAFERPAPVSYVPSNGPIDAAFTIGEGFGATALRLLAAGVLGPLSLLELADGIPGLESFIVNTVDAPLWIADPLLYGLRDALPIVLGGGAGGTVEQFRNAIWSLTEEINDFILGLPNYNPIEAIEAAIAETLYIAFDRPAPVPYTQPGGPIDALFSAGEGFVASGLRLAVATVFGPLRLLELGNGLAGLEDFIVNTVDAPLWIADPILYGLRDALPVALGGGANGAIENLRDGIWQLTEDINDAILRLLPQQPAVSPSMVTLEVQELQTISYVATQDVAATLEPAADATTPEAEPADTAATGSDTDAHGEEAGSSTADTSRSSRTQRNETRSPIIHAKPGDANTGDNDSAAGKDSADGDAAPAPSKEREAKSRSTARGDRD